MGKKSFKKSILAVILGVARLFKVGALLNAILKDHRNSVCKARVTASEGVRFGEAAIVHCPPEQRSRVVLGKNAVIDGELLVHDYGGKIEIGEHSYVGLGSRVWSGESVKIGKYVLLAHNVNITDTNSHQFDERERAEHYDRTTIGGKPFQRGSIKTAPVVIEDHVWINFGASILKGVRIGRGAVIGANSMITKDVPPYTVVAGNPARVIRQLERPSGKSPSPSASLS